jgi:hypothetical protein
MKPSHIIERFSTVPARLTDSSHYQVNLISDSIFLTNVFKGDDLYSFVHGFGYVDLKMARKLGRNNLP